MTKYEERLCRTCKYGIKPEYHKPCVVYRDDCRLYESIEEMTPEKAINTLKTWVKRDEAMEYADRDEIIEIYKMAIKALEIELLTDTEQRIFLAAIQREREVCQEVDDEFPYKESQVSLVQVCNSIERKVKKIWE